MWHDGIRTIVPLCETTRATMACMTPSKPISRNWAHPPPDINTPATTAFFRCTTSSHRRLPTLLIGSADPNSVGIYLAAFDEVVGVFHSAANNSTLSATPWYGSDGVALSAALTGDVNAAASLPRPDTEPDLRLPMLCRVCGNRLPMRSEARTGITADALRFPLTTRSS